MAGVAVAIFALLSLALYSLSQISRSPWSRDLSSPTIQASYRHPLPQFEFTENGKRYDDKSLLGRWTLLSFWSHTCAPCLAEMPDLNQLAQTWGGPELGVITVNTDQGEDLEQAKLFLSEQQIALETVFDKQGILSKAFAVETIPRHYLINPEGQVVWSEGGAFRWTENRTRDQLLKLMELAQEKSQDPQESP